MNNRYWLFRRHGVFYLQDAQTRQKESLHTRSRREAEQIAPTQTRAKGYILWTPSVAPDGAPPATRQNLAALDPTAEHLQLLDFAESRCNADPRDELTLHLSAYCYGLCRPQASWPAP